MAKKVLLTLAVLITAVVVLLALIGVPWAGAIIFSVASFTIAYLFMGFVIGVMDYIWRS